MDPQSARKQLGGVFVLIGGLLLATALLAPWFSIDLTGAGGWHEDSGLYLDLPSWDGTVVSCGESGCPSLTSYSGASLDSTSMVAEITGVLIATATALGLIAGALGAVSRRTASRDLSVILLAVAALVLGVFATVFFAASIQMGVGGPWGSFWGSKTQWGTGAVWTTTWGPSTGWYLSIVAAGAILAGVAILFWRRHDLAESPSSSVSSEPAPSSIAPAQPPP
jgi:hypothetical protein